MNSALRDRLIVVKTRRRSLLLRRLVHVSACVGRGPRILLHSVTCAYNLGSTNRPIGVTVITASLGSLSRGFALTSEHVGDTGGDRTFAGNVCVNASVYPTPKHAIFLFPNRNSRCPSVLESLALRFPTYHTTFSTTSAAITTCLSSVNASPARITLPDG